MYLLCMCVNKKIFHKTTGSIKLLVIILTTQLWKYIIIVYNIIFIKPAYNLI